jgi:hypothetical protein
MTIEDAAMDETDLERIAQTLAGIGYVFGVFKAGDSGAKRAAMLAMLSAKDASGAPDPFHDRKLYYDMIEIMSDDDVKALWNILFRTPL